MSLILLTARKTLPSARQLRDAIKTITNRHLVVTSNSSFPGRGDKVVVRYGNPYPISPYCQDTIYNSPEAIELLINKARFSERLLNAGFIAPEFFRHPLLPHSEDYPVMIRKTLTGFGGIGIIFARNAEEFSSSWRPNYVWCKYLRVSSEFRYHIANPEQGDPIILRVSKKILRAGEVERTLETRNNRRWRFSLRTSPERRYPRLTRSVLSVARELDGFKLFSLDVGWSRDFSAPVYFEGNSASGLEETSAMDYANFLVREGIME